MMNTLYILSSYFERARSGTQLFNRKIEWFSERLRKAMNRKTQP